MFENIQWVFFDVGSTLMDERVPYEHRMREMADAAGRTYENVYSTAMEFYRQNKKGDLETAKRFGVQVPRWHSEEEFPYSDACECLRILSGRYKTGIIANQPPRNQRSAGAIRHFAVYRHSYRVGRRRSGKAG